MSLQHVCVHACAEGSWRTGKGNDNPQLRLLLSLVSPVDSSPSAVTVLLAVALSVVLQVLTAFQRGPCLLKPYSVHIENHIHLKPWDRNNDYCLKLISPWACLGKQRLMCSKTFPALLALVKVRPGSQCPHNYSVSAFSSPSRPCGGEGIRD